MPLTLHVFDLLGLFAAMAAMAAMPGVSTLTVAGRSASAGLGHGAATVLGIVVADVCLLLVALLGLVLLVTAADGAFFIVRLAAGAWLFRLAVITWRSRHCPVIVADTTAASLSGSFIAGLLMTLADQKAVLFYLAFLPAFVDLARLTVVDVWVVVAAIVVAVGGVKLAYALAAERLAVLAQGRGGRLLHGAAVVLLLASGLLVLFGY